MTSGHTELYCIEGTFVLKQGQKYTYHMSERIHDEEYVYVIESSSRYKLSRFIVIDEVNISELTNLLLN